LGRCRSALQQLGGALLAQSVRYEAALGALCRGSVRSVAARRVAVQARITVPLFVLQGLVLGSNTRPGIRQTTRAYHHQSQRQWSRRCACGSGVVAAGGAMLTVCAVHAAQAASQNLTVAAARYGAARSALGLLGPLMWAWLGADLALKALGTDYGRLVRAIFALCQIRLLRTHGFVNPT
jgi:hypothetical protein